MKNKKKSAVDVPSHLQNLPEDQPNTYYAVGQASDGQLFVRRIGSSTESERKLKSAFKAFKAEATAAYTNLFELREDGSVDQVFELSNPELQKLNQSAKQLVYEQFDAEYPRVAEALNKFVDVAVGDMMANSTLKLPEGLIPITEVEYGHFLKQDLTGREKDFLAGKFESMVGFGLQNGLTAMFPFSLGSYKYREARAISEIARRMNARFIFFTNEVWVRNPKTGQRTGQEGLNAMVVLPDGSVAAAAGAVYERKNDKLRVVHPIDLIGSANQHLFPAWSETVSAQQAA
jgi:hypothetical protein